MYGGESISNQQGFAKITQKPRCIKAYVKNPGDKSIIRIELEQILAAEIVGYTKLKVGVSPTALAAKEPVIGQELIPPEGQALQQPNISANYYLDLKCEEDLPEEDDEDYEYPQDEFDG